MAGRVAGGVGTAERIAPASPSTRSDPWDALPPELRALLPSPAQDRAQDTVAAIADAAVAILDEAGGDGFTIEEVRRRSGATTGSIYHHFGDATRLLAGARALRFRRSILAGTERAVARYAGATDADALARITRLQVAARDRPEARAAVWILSDAIAAARDLPDLAAAVSATFRDATTRHEHVLLGLRARGLLAPDVDPRTMLLVSRTLSHARLLDDLDPDPVPHHDWVAVSCRVHDGLLDPRPLVRDTPVDRQRVLTLRAAIRATDIGGPGEEDAATVEAGGDPRRADLIARARVLLVSAGPAAVQVGRLREETGVSAGWFHRAFGDRDALLDAVRLDLLERTMSTEIRSFSALVALARTPDELVDAVADWVADPPHGPIPDRLRFQYTDLLVAARQRPALGHEAGRIISRMTAGMAEVVVVAQEKGLLRPDLAPRAVARVAHATVYGAMLIELDGRPVDAGTWGQTLRRGLRQLTR